LYRKYTADATWCYLALEAKIDDKTLLCKAGISPQYELILDRTIVYELPLI
jgi:hypothetical protein